jgi:hypothetical protein
MTDDLARPEVTLANWQEPPAVRWSFQHMRELMPSHVVEAGDPPRRLPQAVPETGPKTGADLGGVLL